MVPGGTVGQHYKIRAWLTADVNLEKRCKAKLTRPELSGSTTRVTYGGGPAIPTEGRRKPEVFAGNNRFFEGAADLSLVSYGSNCGTDCVKELDVDLPDLRSIHTPVVGGMTEP